MTNGRVKGVTAVLVHAAWADGSSWHKVIRQLEEAGFNVQAAQIPLTSLSDDVAALKRALQRTEGPVVAAGHSYGGAVITAAATDEPRVKALVYIAAMAPDAGETVGSLLQRVGRHPSAPALTPDGNGLVWLPRDAFATAVAPDAPPDETAVMAATQKPISVACIGEPMTEPAWKHKPSWFLVANKDYMIVPETQRFMAERAHSHIRALDVDHTPLASAAEAVSELVVEAAHAVL